MSKKTESLEIRVSPELKSALARISAAGNRTMSDTVRDLIATEIDGRGSLKHNESDPIMLKSTTSYALRAGLFALPVLALGAIYSTSLQSPAIASTEARIFFAELDRDQNDSVDVAEYTAFLSEDEVFLAETDCTETGEPCTAAELATEEITIIDADGDGQVGYPEFEAFILRQRAEEFLEFDLDGNGLVSHDEVALTFALFAKEDGEQVSTACTEKLATETAEGAAGACGDTTETRLIIAELDADRDGKISLLEFLAR